MDEPARARRPGPRSSSRRAGSSAAIRRPRSRRATSADPAAAVPFSEALTGETAHRFRSAGAELAAVGPFLLLSAGPGEPVARVAATVTVDDLPATQRLLTDLGAEIIAPAAATPNGHRPALRAAGEREALECGR